MSPILRPDSVSGERYINSRTEISDNFSENIAMTGERSTPTKKAEAAICFCEDDEPADFLTRSGGTIGPGIIGNALRKPVRIGGQNRLALANEGDMKGIRQRGMAPVDSNIIRKLELLTPEITDYNIHFLIPFLKKPHLSFPLPRRGFGGGSLKKEQGLRERCE